MSYETKTWIYRGMSLVLIIALLILHVLTLNELGVININNQDTTSIEQEKNESTR